MVYAHHHHDQNSIVALPQCHLDESKLLHDSDDVTSKQHSVVGTVFQPSKCKRNNSSYVIKFPCSCSSLIRANRLNSKTSPSKNISLQSAKSTTTSLPCMDVGHEVTRVPSYFVRNCAQFFESNTSPYYKRTLHFYLKVFLQSILRRKFSRHFPVFALLILWVQISVVASSDVPIIRTDGK